MIDEAIAQLQGGEPRRLLRDRGPHRLHAAPRPTTRSSGEERATAVRNYIARPARHRAQPDRGDLLRRGQAGRRQQDPGRPRAEPARRHQRSSSSVPRRPPDFGRPARTGAAPAAGRRRMRRPSWTFGRPDRIVALPPGMRPVRPADRSRAGAGRRDEPTCSPGRSGEPVCLRGDREALPAPRLRYGPPHRAPPRRGRRRGPGGLPARASRSLAASTSARPFGPWICRIAANLAVNHVRSPRAREEALPGRRTPRRRTTAPGARSAGCWTTRRGAESWRGRWSGLSAGAARRVRPARRSTSSPTRRSRRRSSISIGTVMSRLSAARERLRVALSPYLGAAWRAGGRRRSGERAIAHERLSAFLDGELPPRRGPPSQRHCAACPACARGSPSWPRWTPSAAALAATAPGGYFEALPGPRCAPASSRAGRARVGSRPGPGRRPRRCCWPVVTPLTLSKRSSLRMEPAPAREQPAAAPPPTLEAPALRQSAPSAPPPSRRRPRSCRTVVRHPRRRRL